MKELRCPNKKHAELDDDKIEVKCNSRFCGAEPGVVVLHVFDSSTGELVATSRFKDPAFISRRKDTRASSAERIPAVRNQGHQNHAL